MTPRRERETPILRRGVFQRVPEPHCRRRVRVQEHGVLVRRHAAADLRLLADDHGLQHARVAEAQRARYRGVLGVDGHCREGRVEVVQVVADFVDGAVFGFGQGAG